MTQYTLLEKHLSYISNSVVTELIGDMTGPAISIGLGARGLRDRDFLSLSDPYVTIARPDTSWGFRVIRTSETKKVNCIQVKLL